MHLSVYVIKRLFTYTDKFEDRNKSNFLMKMNLFDFNVRFS